jgi:signal transduction histidine kinase
MLRRSTRAYAESLAPSILVWLVLVGWLASLISGQAKLSEKADEALVKEWLDEARTFRKTLPELVREHLRLRAESADARRLELSRETIAEQMRSLAEPTRVYLNQLPGFPVVYKLEVLLPPDAAGQVDRFTWLSPLPRPRGAEVGEESRVRELTYSPLTGEPAALVRCEYQMHAFNKLQHRETERRRVNLVATAVLVAATLLTVLFVARFLRRERGREMQRLTTLAEAEHRERELLETRLRQKEDQQAREEAERSALELKSQLYAGIGIMAGSYAHNIKNLLVRPNDLLARCIEANGLNDTQSVMLDEVRSTLGTVTERLQQILRTVRRDPSKAEMTSIDLFDLARATAKTWDDTGRDKWKLRITAEVPPGKALVRGDASHLQQAVENLVFNARDATFERRNALREAARADPSPDPDARRKRLIEAAGWRGEISLRAFIDGDRVVLEVSDNGIGMTDEVRENCLKTHFSTKRDNALYEGYSAGMGLGLSFVAVVLEHHHAELTITSAPNAGATFRVAFPRVTDS